MSDCILVCRTVVSTPYDVKIEDASLDLASAFANYSADPNLASLTPDATVDRLYG